MKARVPSTIVSCLLACALFFVTVASASAATRGGSPPPPIGGIEPSCPSGFPVLGAAPTVSLSGSTITTTDGSWSGCGSSISSYSYGWLRDGAIVPGATARTYTIPPADIGAHVFASTVNACTAVDFCATDAGGAAESANTIGGPVILGNSATSFTVANHDALLTIYKQCLGPNVHGNTNVTIGPGYIGRVDRINGDGTFTRVLDDERAADYRNGGLGTFGFHGARRNASPSSGGNKYFDDANAWFVEGRRCASHDWNPVTNSDFDGGVGVASATVTQEPIKIGAGVEFAMTIVFRDVLAASLLSTKYRYRITDSQVQLWTTVTETPGAYAATTDAFIKEPKFEFKLGTPTGTSVEYKRVTALDNNGTIVTNLVSPPAAGSACSFIGSSASQTRNCDGDARYRLRYDYGTSETDANGYCPSLPTDTCLNVVGKSVAAVDQQNVTTFLWEKAGYGLDQWGHAAWLDLHQASPTMRRFAAVDGVRDGSHAQCHFADSEEWNRRWELGGEKTDGVTFTRANGLMKGWEGSVGAYDCEPLSWSDNGSGPWGNYFSISFGPGWTDS